MTGRSSSPASAWLRPGSLGAIALAISLAPAAGGVQLNRGPYLQSGSTTGVAVRWRTDVAADTAVHYGLDPLALGLTFNDPALVTEHVATLGGLSQGTRYYYEVSGGGSTLASGPDFFFETSPASARPTRIWAIGDAGTANANQLAVRDAYLAYAGTRHTDLWLMLGDNAYVDGTDAQYQAAVFDVYGMLLRSSVVWTTLGNHDGHTADSGTQTGPYYDIFTLPKLGEAGGVASGTEAYYSFDYGNVHFVCLESYETDRSATGPMAEWLRDDLADTTRDWIVAFWHHPPYSKGSHDSDVELELVEMRQNILPILEDGGVDLVLSGHSHAYERTKFLDGHYGASGTLVAGMIRDAGSGREDGSGAYEKPALGAIAHQGAVYVVAGASGQIGGGALNHPAMYVSLNALGSLVLDVDGSRLDARYLDETGAVRDYFTLRKPRLKGDLDGDGRTDLLLNNVFSNRNVAWLMNGTTRLAGLFVTPDPDGPEWRLAGSDEFTGGGTNDLVFQNTLSGAVQVWSMNGVTRVGSPLPLAGAPVLGSQWRLCATGDFDADLKPDLVWQDSSTSALQVWRLDGLAYVETRTPSPSASQNANWRVVAAVDFDRDGFRDLLWYNATSGKLVTWRLDGALVRLSGAFTNPPAAADANWKVVAAGDYGVGPSGVPLSNDVVWRNDTTGKLVVWHMDLAGNRTFGTFTTPASPANATSWNVVGPR